MVKEYNNQKFMTDNDLKVNILGFWPRWDIQNRELCEVLKENENRDFLGGDEIISYAQHLVSSGMNFKFVEEEILTDIRNPEKGELKNIVFNKTATGIGRGHSLGGLSGVVLGLNGTKMIDSGLTGFVASRSLATSSRRRETTTEEIVIPESLFQRQDLLQEYLKISQDVFNVSKQFKERFGKLNGVQTFNKIIPYNNPADLFIVLPLDTLATLAFEAKQDRLNPNGNFLPKELLKLADMASEITTEVGLNTMYEQRIQVPRDTYMHYTVFKDPSLSNYALERAELAGMPLEPIVLDNHRDLTGGFKKEINKLKNFFEETKKITDPAELNKSSMRNMLALRSFVNDYNEAVGVKILDTLSWRVWSEQKRHSTLKQNVESVYSAADRAYGIIKDIWPQIELANKTEQSEFLPYSKLDEAIIIDERLKENPHLIIPYVYNTAKQLMFYGKLMEEGFEQRDALYIVPKNIKVRTLENYDLINLIDLELPLRLCSTCEPERYATSWKKRKVISEVIPELDYFLQPKCNIGFCTENPYCNHITDLRKYNKELHKQTKDEMLKNTNI